jgi:hypothetical protein
VPRRDGQKTQDGIETHFALSHDAEETRRDGQKTQDGIETIIYFNFGFARDYVETGRKPRTGLKHDRSRPGREIRDVHLPHDGIETSRAVEAS